MDANVINVPVYAFNIATGAHEFIGYRLFGRDGKEVIVHGPA